MPSHDPLPRRRKKRNPINRFARYMDGFMQRRRKPPEAGLAVPAVPPKGPLPKQGGAEAPLEFD